MQMVCVPILFIYFFFFGFSIRSYGKGEGKLDATISHIKYFDKIEAKIYCDKCNDVVAANTLLIHHIGIGNITQKLMTTIFPKQVISAFDIFIQIRPFHQLNKIPYVKYIYLFDFGLCKQQIERIFTLIHGSKSPGAKATQIAIHMCYVLTSFYWHIIAFHYMPCHWHDHLTNIPSSVRHLIAASEAANANISLCNSKLIC